MNYTIAVAATKTKPLFVYKTDSSTKKDCFIGLDEIPMTESVAKRLVVELNKRYRQLVSK